MINFDGVTICASKYFNDQEMRKLYEKHVFHFGENRAQDLIFKKEALSDLSITWHFIGHLQSNKVKDMINLIDYLHTLDRFSLAETIQKYRIKPLNCFIQLNLTRESQKSGLFIEELDKFLLEIKKYDKINIVGLMTIGKDEDMIETENAFALLEKLANQYHLPYLSMGMSDDYELAIKHHATHLRIGRKFKALLE
ncbi:MAG: YggS family pyridoxal phosphate-dependent enzyme [Bacillota bacterium]|nr:MAG: YggS family pyridoxal phosphate-dependent enzyme [Bacillota bacterium]